MQIESLFNKINTLEDKNTDVIVMDISSLKSNFYFDSKNIELPIGYDFIEKTYFKNTPPKPDEIEYAINNIEDEIEKAVKQMPKDFTLYTTNDFIVDIAILSGEKEEKYMQLSRDKMEYLFGLYSEVSQGRAAFEFQKDLSPLFYAKLLILREFMHHLKFNFLKIINTNS